MCSDILGIDDIDSDVEQIVKLRDESEEERARFMLAIAKEVKGICDLQVFSYERLLDKVDQITTKFVLKVKTKGTRTKRASLRTASNSLPVKTSMRFMQPLQE